MTEQATLEEEKKKEQKAGTTEEVREYDEIPQPITQKEPKTEEEIEIIKEIAKRDEDLIKKEMLGETVMEYFYQFKQGTRTVTGLSIKGVTEIARKMGNIHVMEPKIEEKDGRFDARVEVKDLLNNIVTWGVASQSKVIKSQQYGDYEDEFARQKAYSKARRNALRQLIPETLIAKMFEKWKAVKEQHDKDAKSLSNL